MPLQKTTLTFVENLIANNTREWFTENKPTYESAKADFTQLIGQVMDLCGIGEKVTGNKPANMLFRIYRDVRFSPDKSPYKKNLAAVVAPGGKKDELSGIYIHLQPGESFAASGLYAPMPDQLAAARQELDYNADALKAIVNAKSFKAFFNKIEGESLSRPPKGYEADNANIDLLKMKQFYVSNPITDAEWVEPGIEEKLAEVYKAVQPFNAFFKAAIQGKE